MAGVTGRVKIVVNGTGFSSQVLLNKAGAVASGIGGDTSGTYEKKPVLGDQGVNGFVDEPVVAKLEVTITDKEANPENGKAGVSLTDLAAIDGGVTVIFSPQNSKKSYTLNGVTCQGNITLTAGEGDAAVVFLGDYWSESDES